MTLYTVTSTASASRPRWYRGTHRTGRRPAAQRAEVARITGAWRTIPAPDGRHETGPGTDRRQYASVRRDTELLDGAALAALLTAADDPTTIQSAVGPTLPSEDTP